MRNRNSSFRLLGSRGRLVSFVIPYSHGTYWPGCVSSVTLEDLVRSYDSMPMHWRSPRLWKMFYFLHSNICSGCYCKVFECVYKLNSTTMKPERRIQTEWDTCGWCWRIRKNHKKCKIKITFYYIQTGVRNLIALVLIWFM